MKQSELDLVIAFVQKHPAAAARELEMQPLEEMSRLIQALPLSLASRLVMALLPNYAGSLCTHLPVATVVSLFADCNIQQVVSVMRCMAEKNRQQVQRQLPEKTSALCRLLLGYSEDTVGAWMMVDRLMLPPDITIGDALIRVRQSRRFYGSDELLVQKNGHLRGRTSIGDLLRGRESALISQIMVDSPPALLSHTSLLNAIRSASWQSHDSLPVLSGRQQVVGLIRHLDLRRGMNQSAAIVDDHEGEDLLTRVGGAYGITLNALLDLIFTPSQRPV